MRVLGWSPYLRISRALQRDEAAIAHWQAAVWPVGQEQARQEAHMLVVVDEAGFYLLPGRVKSDAPRGQPTVLEQW